MMMNSKQRPYSMHKLEKRVCQYCSEIFYADHGLQRYCPEKFGKKDHCKYAQKKMVEEKRLADRVEELSKTGMSVREETPLEKNKQALALIMGSDEQKTVEGKLLDHNGYDINYFDFKTPINGTTNFLIHVGNFTLEWIKHEATILYFKITRK
jgi:hypothetical protein